MAILALILSLLLVVGIHEVGHALMAQFFQMKIKRIAIGFGKPLLQWSSTNGYEWTVGRWFFGGYVHLANTRISPEPADQYSYCFDKQAIWKRVLVLLSGSLANVIGAWCAFTIIFYVGLYHQAAIIQQVAWPSIAAQAGIKPGEKIIAVAGQRVNSWQEIGQELVILWGASDLLMTLQVPHEQDTRNVHLDLSHVAFSPARHSLLTSLGITADLSIRPQKESSASVMAAMQQATQTLIHFGYFFIMLFKQLLTGVIPLSALLGPLGFISASVTSLSQGILVFLYFVATLSVAVAFVNLLPIPGLDGGGVVYALIEKIRKQPVSIAVELLLYRFSLIAAFLLFVQLIKNDLFH